MRLQRITCVVGVLLPVRLDQVRTHQLTIRAADEKLVVGVQ